MICTGLFGGEAITTSEGDRTAEVDSAAGVGGLFHVAEEGELLSGTKIWGGGRSL